jgi:hypothetical protein
MGRRIIISATRKTSDPDYSKRKPPKRNNCYENGARARPTFSATQPGSKANAEPTVISYNPGYATMVVEHHTSTDKSHPTNKLDGGR